MELYIIISLLKKTSPVRIFLFDKSAAQRRVSVISVFDFSLGTQEAIRWYTAALLSLSL